jgi:hypothetical protein
MDGRTAILQASLAPGDAVSFYGAGPRDVMAALLGQSYEMLTLRGALLDDFCPGITVYVEDDAEFLVTAALDLEQLRRSREPYRHAATLGDGRLTIASSSDRGSVAATFHYSPALDVASMVIHRVLLIEEQYVWWWRSISRQLRDLAQPDTTRGVR